jgi:MFS family permease
VTQATRFGGGRRTALVVVSVAELLGISLWFSATAVAPELAEAWGLAPGETALLTTAVQIGFVAGAVVSTLLTLADTVPPRWLFASSAAVGSALTVVLALFVSSLWPAVVLRFLTGFVLAGVYPTGMKLLAGWFQRGRGLAIGALVGALTIGSALPHLLRAVGGAGDARAVLLGAATFALVGAVLALLIRPGPHQAPVAPFDPGAIGRILRDRPTVLANLGYFGHMWELYAVWTWIPAYLTASLAVGGYESVPATASLLTFLVIAVGGPGALAAGHLADRVGRTTVTGASMVTSGACCLAAGVVFGAPLTLLVPFVLLWGLVIVADSAQFSAAISELAEGSYVGTALTLQTAIGFLLTTVTIQATPVVADAVGWQWAFLPLVVGPMVGTLAMWRLREHPRASALAGGRG